MKRATLILIAISLFTGLNAQKTGLSFLVGQGTYNCSDLKTYQNELIAAMPVNLVGLSTFPRHTAIKISYFKVNPQQIKYGVFFGSAFTGAHANYSDISGSLTINQTIGSYQLGVSGSYPLVAFPRFDLNAYGNASLSYVKNEVSRTLSTVQIGYWEKTTLNLNAISPFAEAGLEMNLHLEKVTLGLEGGYLYDVGGKFKYPSDAWTGDEADLIPSSDLKSQMSGFRAGVKIILWLNSELIFEE